MILNEEQRDARGRENGEWRVLLRFCTMGMKRVYEERDCIVCIAWKGSRGSCVEEQRTLRYNGGKRVGQPVQELGGLIMKIKDTARVLHPLSFFSIRGIVQKNFFHPQICPSGRIKSNIINCLILIVEY